MSITHHLLQSYGRWLVIHDILNIGHILGSILVISLVEMECWQLERRLHDLVDVSIRALPVILIRDGHIATSEVLFSHTKFYLQVD